MNVKYRFEFADKPSEDIKICIDNCTLEASGPLPTPLPAWTKLVFHQCPHCPLNSAETPHCPLAARISGVIGRFEAFVSHDDVTVKVATKDRVYACRTTVQRGLGSLLGLVIATSGCPHMDFFRPMARFHLPFASEEETVFRVSGMYLIGQFFRKVHGDIEAVDLSGLATLYANVEIVNTHITARLREVTSKDASVNAVILLDFFAKSMSYVIDDHMEDLRYLYSAYLNDPLLSDRND